MSAPISRALNRADDEHAGIQARLAVLRARHNAFADVETLCTGTAAKLKRYAPLLREIAKAKADLRQQMRNVDPLAGYEQA